jgi:hypothetical protein
LRELRLDQAARDGLVDVQLVDVQCHTATVAERHPRDARDDGFESIGHGCRMTDTITLGSPIFGRLAERLALVPYLRRLIIKRNEHLLATLA